MCKEIQLGWWLQKWKGRTAERVFEGKFLPPSFSYYLSALSIGYVSGFHYLNVEFAQVYIHCSSLSLKFPPFIAICVSESLHFPRWAPHTPVPQTQYDETKISIFTLKPVSFPGLAISELTRLRISKSCLVSLSLSRLVDGRHDRYNFFPFPSISMASTVVQALHFW